MRNTPHLASALFSCLFVSAGLLLAPGAVQTAAAQGRLAITPSDIHFGNVVVGQEKSLPCTLSNPGTARVTVATASSNRGAFEISQLTLPMILGPGASVPCMVQFTPRGVWHVDAAIGFASNASDPKLSLTVHGTGVSAGTLVARPASLDFGNVQVGNSETLPMSVTNVGFSAVQIAKVVSTGSAFTLSALNLPLKLAPSESVTFNVTFAPKRGGPRSRTILLSSSATDSTLTIPISATGLAPGDLAPSATVVPFGPVAIGTHATLMETLTAVGGTVIVSGASIDNPQFSIRRVTFPFKIQANQTVPVYFRFDPGAAGLSTATVTFTSNAQDAPPIVALRGHGFTPQHVVALSWNASTSLVTGYNVYRGSESDGPYTRINSTEDGATAYDDRTVVSGDTYYYVVTSVNSSGKESRYSSQLGVTIPSP